MAVSRMTAPLGQPAASVGSSELYTRVIGSPWAWSPRGSMKNAPTVSPAQLNPASGVTCPASCNPELKMYWSGVPLGQKPPPTTGELFGSTHSSPILLMPQKKRLTFMTPNVNANKFVPLRLAGRLGLGLAEATPAVVARSAAASVARTARVHQVDRISSLEERSLARRRPSIRAPPASVRRLEAQLHAQPDVPGRSVEVLLAVEQVVIRVQRARLLGDAVHAVAVAEPRFGAAQHDAVHGRRIVVIPRRARRGARPQVDVTIGQQRIVALRLDGQPRELVAQGVLPVQRVHDVARLGEDRRDVLEVEHVAGVGEGRHVQPADPEALVHPHVDDLLPRHVRVVDRLELRADQAQRLPRCRVPG